MSVQTLKKLSENPCVLCSGKPEIIASFEPENPEKFGVKPGMALYFPVCLKCSKEIDPEFVEALLLHCGHKIRPEREKIFFR